MNSRLWLKKGERDEEVRQRRRAKWSERGPRFSVPENVDDVIDDDPLGLLEMFKLYQAPKIEKWIDRSLDDVTGGKSK